MNKPDSLAIPIRRADAAKCADQHFGAWAIEPRWFANKVAAIRAGVLKPRDAKADFATDDDSDTDDVPLYSVQDGVALIAIEGQMTKRGSSYGGCSTIAVRQAIRTAVNDVSVRAIMLSICSPGGTVMGTSDLASDVANAAKSKPVDGYLSDMCCSAAYWVASQCRTLYANDTAMVGNIGTFTVLEDDTGKKWCIQFVDFPLYISGEQVADTSVGAQALIWSAANYAVFDTDLLLHAGVVF